MDEHGMDAPKAIIYRNDQVTPMATDVTNVCIVYITHEYILVRWGFNEFNDEGQRRFVIVLRLYYPQV